MGSAFVTLVEGPDIDDAGEQVTFGAPSFAAVSVPVPTDFARGDNVRRLRAIDEQAALILSQGEAEIAQPLDLAQVEAAADRLRQRITDRLATPPPERKVAIESSAR